MTTSRQSATWIRGTTMYHLIRQGKQVWCGVKVPPDHETTTSPASYLVCARCHKLSSSTS